MKLKLVLQKLDLFGVPITIRYQGSQNHKTLLGGFITLLILFMLFYQVFVTLKSLLNYENFNIIYQENIVQSPTAFEIKPEQFTLAFGIQSANYTALLDEQLYYVEAIFDDTKRIFNETTNQYEFVLNQINFQIVPCTKEHFLINGTVEYFLKLPYKDLYCLPLDLKLSFEGQFGANVFKALRFKIKKCIDPLKCKKIEEVEQVLDTCFLQVYYVNYVVEITNKDAPFQPVVQTNFWQPSISQKNIYMFFRNTFINSDVGLVQKSLQNDQALLYSFDRDQVINVQNDVMFELTLMLEKNKESQYIRKYQKLNESISQLGGMFNFLFALGAALCYPFSKLIFHQKMLNDLFKFQPKKQNFDSQKEIRNNINSKTNNISLANQNEDNKNEQGNKKTQKNTSYQQNEQNIAQIVQNPLRQAIQSSRKKSFLFQKKQTQYDEVIESKQNESKITASALQNLKQSENLSKSKSISEDYQPNNLNVQLKQQQKRKSEQRDILSIFQVSINEITIKIKDLLSSFFSSRQSYSRMIKYGLDKLNYQLDIQAIITKLLEIEKLKQLVLNEDQIKLFEFIPQPVIHEEMFDNQTKEEFEKAQELNPLLKTGIFYEDRRNLVEKAIDAQDAFNKIFKSPNPTISNVDRKLLSLLDPRVSTRFNENMFRNDKDVINRSKQISFLSSPVNYITSPVNDYSTLMTENVPLFGHKLNTAHNKDDEPLGN